MAFISNARMYAVSPDAEQAWAELIARVAALAGTSFNYQAYPAPRPLEDLWRHTDIGCVQMCGYPIARKVADVVPLASPIPAAGWAQGKAVYRSDLIVRADAPYETLAETFPGTAGWTVSHSHSGFNAFRHHLLKYRTARQTRLFRHTVGNLITARNIIDRVVDGTIDVGPLDAYWHMLIRKYDPELTAGIRVLETTEAAPMPAFVASTDLSGEIVLRLQNAFACAHTMPWFEPFRDTLLIEGFEPVTHDTFARTLDWNKAAVDAGYPEPA